MSPNRSSLDIVAYRPIRDRYNSIKNNTLYVCSLMLLPAFAVLHLNQSLWKKKKYAYTTVSVQNTFFFIRFVRHTYNIFFSNGRKKENAKVAGTYFKSARRIRYIHTRIIPECVFVYVQKLAYATKRWLIYDRKNRKIVLRIFRTTVWIFVIYFFLLCIILKLRSTSKRIFSVT